MVNENGSISRKDNSSIKRKGSCTESKTAENESLSTDRFHNGIRKVSIKNKLQPKLKIKESFLIPVYENNQIPIVIGKSHFIEPNASANHFSRSNSQINVISQNHIDHSISTCEVPDLSKSIISRPLVFNETSNKKLKE